MPVKYAFFIPLVLAAASVPVAAEPPNASVFGVWLNPHKTVKVQTASCGRALCGTIVWAAPEALSDAKDAGVDKLIGLQLLSGYQQKSPGHWQGTVYVPDLKRSFFSRIEQVGAGGLKISGCILGGLICKSQLWTRA